MRTLKRSLAATIADAIAVAGDTERRSAEMSAHLVEMTQAVMQAGGLYHALGMAIAAGPKPTRGMVQDAHRAGLDAERAVRRFQRTFHDWLRVLDRASRTGVALYTASAPEADPTAASVH